MGEDEEAEEEVDADTINDEEELLEEVTELPNYEELNTTKALVRQALRCA